MSKQSQRLVPNDYYKTFRRPLKSLTTHNIILDLDETLVRSIDDIGILNELGILTNAEYTNLRNKLYRLKLDDCLESRGSGVCSRMWGIKRPYLNEFIEWCFTYFNLVMVWTAGQPQYAKELVKVIFHDAPSPDVTYDMRSVVVINKEGEYCKPLENLFRTERITKIAGLHNTFLVDDKFDNSIVNIDNAVVIPPFEPESTIEGITNLEKNDNALKVLQKWFMRKEVMECDDIRTLDKTQIFATNRPV